MKPIIFIFLISICSGCSGYSGAPTEVGVGNDSKSVKTFPVSLGEGKTIAVLASRDKNSQVFRSYIKHKDELDASSKTVDKYPGPRVFNYKGPEARYSLIVPNSAANRDWYLVCPYRLRLAAGTQCILFGRADNYVFQTYIDDVGKFDLIVSAIEGQKHNYIK